MNRYIILVSAGLLGLCVGCAHSMPTQEALHVVTHREKWYKGGVWE